MSLQGPELWWHCLQSKSHPPASSLLLDQQEFQTLSQTVIDLRILFDGDSGCSRTSHAEISFPSVSFLTDLAAAFGHSLSHSLEQTGSKQFELLNVSLCFWLFTTQPFFNFNNKERTCG